MSLPAENPFVPSDQQASYLQQPPSPNRNNFPSQNGENQIFTTSSPTPFQQPYPPYYHAAPATSVRQYSPAVLTPPSANYNNAPNFAVAPAPNANLTNQNFTTPSSIALLNNKAPLEDTDVIIPSSVSVSSISTTTAATGMANAPPPLVATEAMVTSEASPSTLTASPNPRENSSTALPPHTRNYRNAKGPLPVEVQRMKHRRKRQTVAAGVAGGLTGLVVLGPLGAIVGGVGGAVATKAVGKRLEKQKLNEIAEANLREQHRHAPPVLVHSSEASQLL